MGVIKVTGISGVGENEGNPAMRAFSWDPPPGACVSHFWRKEVLLFSEIATTVLCLVWFCCFPHRLACKQTVRHEHSSVLMTLLGCWGPNFLRSSF